MRTVFLCGAAAMTGAIVRMRVSDATQPAACGAARTGELVEMRDKRGIVHRGWVRGVDYEMGIDQGWFIWFEHQADYTTQDIIAQVLQLNEGMIVDKSAAHKTKANRKARRRGARR